VATYQWTAQALGAADKMRENRFRRIADRQGLRLEKSRRSEPRATDYGTHMLIDASTPARQPSWLAGCRAATG